MTRQQLLDQLHRWQQGLSQRFQQLPPWAPWAIGGTAAAVLLGSLAYSFSSNLKLKELIMDLLPINGVEKQTEAFKVKVIKIANDLKIDPNFLMAIMSFESGGINPKARNASSGATGLIQFMFPKELGTTLEALRQMDAVQQLDYVKLYFQKRIKERGPVKTLSDTYMAVFLPAYIGKAEDAVLFRSGTSGYSQNAALDRGKKGYFTKADAASFPQALYDAGVKKAAAQALVV